MIRSRTGPYREVLEEVIAVDTVGAPDNPGPVTASARLSGLSSLLKVGLYVDYFTDQGVVTADRFAGPPAMSFDILGYIADASGQLAPSSLTPINDGGTMQLPEGWELSSTLDAVQINASVFTLVPTFHGSWKVIVVLEPADSGVCSFFDDLVARVSLAATVKQILNSV